MQVYIPSRMPPETWEVAGLTLANGRLDRPLAASEIVIPERVDLLPATAQRPLRIAWYSSGSPRERRPDDRLLDAFVKLHDDLEGKRVLRYARQYGPLGICADHDLPTSHNPRPTHLGGYQGIAYWCETRGYHGRNTETGYDAWEPIAAWHLFARQAQAILDVAARLHEEELPRIEDWEVIYERQPGVDPGRWKARAKTASHERHILALILNEWLELGNVRPVISWRPQQSPAIELRAGLFGVIAMQLVQVVARTVGLWTCSGCGHGYARETRPREGDERNYCPGCRAAGRPLRDAKYAYRQRKSREAKGARRGKKSTR